MFSRPGTKTDIMELYWLEFLEYKKQWQDKRILERKEYFEKTPDSQPVAFVNADELIYPGKLEQDFWYWYMDNKMERE